MAVPTPAASRDLNIEPRGKNSMPDADQLDTRGEIKRSCYTSNNTPWLKNQSPGSSLFINVIFSTTDCIIDSVEYIVCGWPILKRLQRLRNRVMYHCGGVEVS